MQIHSLPGFHEPVGSLLHLLGALVFAALGLPLLRRAAGDPRRVALFAVYVIASVFLLAMSGVYHMLAPASAASTATDGSVGARAVLARLDKAAIFVLIAGTHTPVQGLFFRGVARWGVLALVWAIAATGIALFTVFFDELPRGLGTSVYLLLGWIAGTSGLVIWRRWGTSEIRLLLLGGVVYSAGAVLLGLEWPVVWPGVIGPHEVWHVAVLGGMALHWRFLFAHARRGLDEPPPQAVVGAGPVTG